MRAGTVMTVGGTPLKRLQLFPLAPAVGPPPSRGTCRGHAFWRGFETDLAELCFRWRGACLAVALSLGARYLSIVYTSDDVL